MFRLFFLITLFFLQRTSLAERPKDSLRYPDQFMAKAEKKEIPTSINVKITPDKKETLSYEVMGIHPQSCASCLRILGRYENFTNYLGFLKKSQYVEKTNDLSLRFELEILPHPLNLSFKLPRMTGPGDYPFVFPTGIFPGLKGTIFVRNHSKDRCLFYVKAYWEGEPANISPTILELFLITISKNGLEKLFRISTL